MSKRISVVVLLSVVLLLLVAGIAQAEEPRPTPTNLPYQTGDGDGTVRGSIRGSVFQDVNGDGRCIGTGEPAAVGIPIEFVSNDGQVVLYLQSGDNGTYGLVAAGLGTWTVTVRPPQEFVTTSAPSRQAFLSAEQRLVEGVDFCVRARAGGTPPPGWTPGPGWMPGPMPTYPVVLPESGAPAQGAVPMAANGLVLLALLGLALLLAGAGLGVRSLLRAR